MQSIVRSFSANPTLVLAMAFVTVAFAYGAYAALVRQFEQRQLFERAIGALPMELVGGIVLGALMMTFIVGILAISGGYDLSPAHWTDWPHDIREAIGTGFLEELLARLVLFRLLASAFKARTALLLSALIFGGAHLANPHASIVSAAAIAAEAGLMLAGFYLLTGRIWMSIGVHAGWNFAQGAIFGTPVSGMPSDGSLFSGTPHASAPAWWTGGSFGPEGSLIAITVGLAAFLVTLSLMKRRSTCIPPHDNLQNFSHKPVK